MANALKLVQVTPINNPDTNIVKVTVSGNYTITVADPLPLGAISDPTGVGQVPFNNPTKNPPLVTPYILNQDSGGYFAQVKRIVTAGVTTFGLRWFTAAGAELATGAFPVGITGGEIFMAILVPVSINA